MATRLPYYTGDDDIYSQLMAQFAQETPYYSAAPATGLLGGYDAGLYNAPAAPAAARMPFMGGGGGYTGEVSPGAPGEGIAPISLMNPEEQANYYANNPTMAAITQGLQNLFGYTTLGMLQNAMVPDFVQAQQEIAQGIVPGSVNSVSAQNAMDVGAHPALGFGAGLAAQQAAAQQAANNQSLTGGLLNFSGTQAPAPVVDAIGINNNVDVTGFGAYGENVAPGSSAPAPGAPDGGYGSYGENVAPDGGGDGGGGGGGKIICTKLYHLGKMSEEIFKADQAFGARLVKDSPETYAGYVVWARHVVGWMGREDWIGKTVVAITNAIATPWSVAMAEEMGVNVKSNWFGRMLLKRGLQMCRFIGKMNQEKGLQNV